MSKPVISIIGTIYNQAKQAERTIDIWCRQRFEHPYEIIVLDDGSTDNTREMITEMQSKYPGLIRYFYFDEPDLIRNCTLLFNTAVRRLIRSEIAVIQWYDRIPSTFDALKILYEPHLRENKICVSFLTRMIAGSSSRDVIEESEVDRLLDTVNWREDPMELMKIMGVPGPHCYPHTMNESACFSVKKRHLEEINGYDERYVKVANYSNIELYGRLKKTGITMIITDNYTFHQPHESNRLEIQKPIEQDTVIKKNTFIRQDWGNILPEGMLSEDRCQVSLVIQTEAERIKYRNLLSEVDMEVLVEEDFNVVLKKATGKIMLFILDMDEDVDIELINQFITMFEKNLKIGCIGTSGGNVSYSDNGNMVKFKSLTVEVVCGSLFAFLRRVALRNGLRFPDYTDCPDLQVQMIDFSKQMYIWGGRCNLSLTSRSVTLTDRWDGYKQRWEYFNRNQKSFLRLPHIEAVEPMATHEKKIAVLARFLSGNYRDINQLLDEEKVPEGWLYQWRIEYNSRLHEYFRNRNNRDYNKKIEELNVLAVIPARGGSKGLKKKALSRLNGKPLIAHTIEACKESKYVDRVLVSTDDPEIAEVAASYGAHVPFLRPNSLAHDCADLSHVMIHATTWMEMVEDYWYDFLLNLSPTYPLRTGNDVDRAFECIYWSDFRSLQSVDGMNPNPNTYYSLEDDRLQKVPLKRTLRQKTFRQSSFISIMSRRPNYHLPIGEYETYISPAKRDLAYEVAIDKAVDIDSLKDLYLCETILNKTQYQQNEINDIAVRLKDARKPLFKRSNGRNYGILGIIRLDPCDSEYELDGMPLTCRSTLAAMESSCFEEVIVLGGSSHVEESSSWAGVPFIRGKNIFRLDGYPHKKYLERCETILRKKFRHVCVIDGRIPILQAKDIEKLCSVYFNNNCSATISVSPPQVHPYWCKCIEDGGVVYAYANPQVGQRQKLPDVYVKDRALRIACREELLKGRHVHPKCGYFLNKGITVRVETFLDYLKVMSFIKAKRELVADSAVNSVGIALSSDVEVCNAE